MAIYQQLKTSELCIYMYIYTCNATVEEMEIQTRIFSAIILRIFLLAYYIKQLSKKMVENVPLEEVVRIAYRTNREINKYLMSSILVCLFTFSLKKYLHGSGIGSCSRQGSGILASFLPRELKGNLSRRTAYNHMINMNMKSQNNI